MRVFVIHQHTLKCPPVLGSQPLCCPVTSCQWIHHQNWIHVTDGRITCANPWILASKTGFAHEMTRP